MDPTTSTRAGAPLAITIGGALSSLARHPVQLVVRRWNWKAAVLSAAMRSSIFFAVNLTSNLDSAISAVLTELFYRAPMVGTLAAVSQTFRRVQPAWKASLVIMVALPALAHGIEFAIHSLQGTVKLYESVAASVGFSMFTCVLSYWLHRRNVLIVGEGSRPLLVDIFQLPAELLDILVTRPIRLLRGTDSPRDEA